MLVKKMWGNTLQFILSRALIACFFVTPALADSGTAKPSLTGVWTGHIGSLAITACFNDITSSVTYGSYYYQRRLVPINLYGYPDSVGMVSSWHESDGRQHPNILYDYDGTWQIDPVPPNRIHGTWLNRSGKKLPIELTKVEYATVASGPKEETDSGSAASETKPCSSDAYHKAVEQTVDTFMGPVRTTNNVKYRLLARGFPGRKKHAEFTDRAQFIATVELIGNTPPTERINRQLRQRLSPGREGDLLECRRMEFGYAGAGEGFYYEYLSVSVAGNLLVINAENRHDCGEHNEFSEDTYVWNLDTGQQGSFFSLFSGVDTAEGKLPDALDDYIANHLRLRNDPNRLSWKEIQECYGSYELGAYTYKLKLAKTGMTFEIPPLPHGACGESVTLTFKELWPFLNKDGRRFAADIRKAQKAKQ